MRIFRRHLVLPCLLLACAVQPASAAEAVSQGFEAIDAQLRQGQWEAARTASLEEIRTRRKTLFSSYLAGAVARLALAEAGLGREEDAVWHWHIAQNLDRSGDLGKILAAFGKAGELLASHPLRGKDEPPAGLTVPAGEARPARKVAGDLPQLPDDIVFVPAPKGLKVQAVIDAEGRLREPVAVSGGLPGVIWEGLEALRGWRYEPARRGEQAVASFQELELNPPAAKPLPELAALSGKHAETESLLRAGKWQEAGKKIRKLWTAELDGEQPAQQRLAALLALRALADAGAGETEAAVCRWQAAQHLDERLYDADLSPYGTAGAVLDANRWGAARVESVNGRILQPVLTRQPAFPHPGKARKTKLQGIVVLTGIVDKRGSLRQPAVVRMFSITGEEMGELESAAFAKPLSLRGLMAVSALDTFCDWHYRPATLNGGEPVAFQEIVAVPFSTAASPIYGRTPEAAALLRRTGMPDHTGGTYQATRPEAINDAREDRPPG